MANMKLEQKALERYCSGKNELTIEPVISKRYGIATAILEVIRVAKLQAAVILVNLN